MMKNFKKSEIVVYVVALMLVTAGYFNYTATNSNDFVETYSEDVQKMEDTANTGVGDAVLVSNNETDSDKDNSENAENTVSTDSNKEDDGTENVALVDNDENLTSESKKVSENNKQIEENSVESSVTLDNATNNTNQIVNTDTNVTVNTSANNKESNYYASSKLEREKMYASMLSTYQNILNNNSVSETQKSIASKEITKINNTKNSIMICENLIMTKGFDNCVILINENSVNVVVSVKNGLTTERVAQIQNIVSREIGSEVENIHIMEK